MTAFLITLLAGFFFLIGAVIAKLGHNKKGLIDFSLGMAFSVMLILLVFDLLPEIKELTNNKGSIFIIILIFSGIVLLKLIDMLIPHHSHEDEVKKHHHEKHLEHIGVITTVALIIHNIIEGMGIYGLSLANPKMGLVMAIGVGLHNVPFGMEIYTTLEESKKNSWLGIILLTLSTVVSAAIMVLIGGVSDIVLAGLISITIGMIIYLLLFELAPELFEIKNKKSLSIGIIAGVILMAINIIFGG